MREKAVRFGKSASLVGVMSEPPHGAARAGAPAIILLNSGILHHVGACRLHVRIAREMAANGFLALRFDHAGIGDSDVRRDTLPFEKSAVLDVQEAMDYLGTAKGTKQFVLYGLCSGADMAFRAAGVDPRIVGVVQLDAWAYRTPGYYVRHYGPRMLDLGVWKRFVGKRLKSPVMRTDASGSADERDPDSVAPTYRRKFPPKQEVAADLQALIARGVHLRYIFSGDQEDHINHEAQYERSFRSIDFAGKVQVDYLGEADHLFTRFQHQQFVLDAIREWVIRLWPGAPVAASDVVQTPIRKALTHAG